MEGIERTGAPFGAGAMRAARAALAARGLELSRAEWVEIAEGRRAALARVERLEVGEPAIAFIAEVFADSPEIDHDGLAGALLEIQDAFYEARDEADPGISDEELTWALREAFDGRACGDAAAAAELAIELLSGAIGADEEGLGPEAPPGEVAWRAPTDDGWDEDVFAPGWLGERWEDD